MPRPDSTAAVVYVSVGTRDALRAEMARRTLAGRQVTLGELVAELLAAAEAGKRVRWG